MKKDVKTVGFQLDLSHHRRLSKIAEKYSMSPGQYARELIIRSLDSNDDGLLEALNLLAQHVNENQQEMASFRKDLSNDLEGIVTKLNQLLSKKR